MCGMVALLLFVMYLYCPSAAIKLQSIEFVNVYCNTVSFAIINQITSSMVHLLSLSPTLIVLSLQCFASSSLVVDGFVHSSIPKVKQSIHKQKRYHPFTGRCQQFHSSTEYAGFISRSETHQLKISRTELNLSTPTQSEYDVSDIESIWEVYVSQSSNKNNKEKGTSISPSAIIQTFISLAPSRNNIKVSSAEFTPTKNNKQKGKGSTVRCIQRKRSGGVYREIGNAIEVTNVDSVDKVYRIMTKHMELGEINDKAVDCMKSYIEGNMNLDEGDPSKAISLYDQSLESIKRVLPASSADQLPKGLILMKRANAYLLRAENHRMILRTLVTDLTEAVPSDSTMKILYQTVSTHPALSPSIFSRLAGDSKVQQQKFRGIRYRHDLYEFALLHAVQDSLQATQLLPQNSNAWLLAGECLGELRKLKESNQYYLRALELDPTKEDELRSVMEKNRISQEFMEQAVKSGFSGDTLRLALDVSA